MGGGGCVLLKNWGQGCLLHRDRLDERRIKIRLVCGERRAVVAPTSVDAAAANIDSAVVVSASLRYSTNFRGPCRPRDAQKRPAVEEWGTRALGGAVRPS